MPDARDDCMIEPWVPAQQQNDTSTVRPKPDPSDLNDLRDVARDRLRP
jgi:hypothetical protein